MIMWKLRKNPFIIISKIIKFLGTNLTKQVQESYTENYKTSLKETKNNLVKWTFCVHELENLILLRWQYFKKTYLQIQQESLSNSMLP